MPPVQLLAPAGNNRNNNVSNNTSSHRTTLNTEAEKPPAAC